MDKVEIKLKKATLKDLLVIQQLNNKLFEYEMKNGFDNYIKDWPLTKQGKEYFADLIKNQFVVIAYYGDTPIGYLAGEIYDENTYPYYSGLTAELSNMFVEENYRRFGVGGKFFEAFESWCKTKNVKRIFVTASSANENTINFYKKQKFNILNTTLVKNL